MRQGVLLSEEVIRLHLSDLVEHLRASRIDQAEMLLDALAFERLTLPIARDTARSFGYERVHETATHVSASERAVRRNEQARALSEAEQALARWTMPNGK